MKFLKIKQFLFVICFFIITLGYGAEHELLTTTDVSKVMSQILEQHVEQKEISGHILKNAFRIYIDHFDPNRIYLLQSEVDPYLNIGDEAMDQIAVEYRNNNFSAFNELNHVIQNSIQRARDLRGEILNNRVDLFQKEHGLTTSQAEEYSDPDLKIAFANNASELKNRIRNDTKKFIAGEMRRYGVQQIMQNQKQTLAIYDRYLQAQEDAYLYVDDSGHPLPTVQKENLFTLHILKALASSLDAHTTFYNNTEAYDMKVRLEKNFEGIGVVLDQDPNGNFIVSKLVEDGPAAKSGQIQIKDRVISIDGKKVANEPFQNIMDMLRGSDGSEVSLVLSRAVIENGQTNDKTVQVNLKRAPITLNDDRVDVSYEKFGNGIIGKITLHAFYQGEPGVTSENDIRKAIKDLSKKGQIRGLILDLRENSGGFLTQSVKVAGLFITNGVVVISKYSNGKEHYYRDMDGKLAYNGPLIVLTSKATASAAEIVAQALQDYGVALVVGDERTYGKGTIQSQTVTDNTATSFFKVTVGKYYTVSGNTPQIQGVKADILVPGPYSEEHIGEQYLEFALPPDKIKAEYNDDLQDVDSSLKPWYLRYYMPTLQKKEDYWRSMLPLLKKNSEYRISHNKNYQAFLRELKGIKEPVTDADESELGALEAGQKNFGAEDLQMAEAVNIVKDMVILQSQPANVQSNQVAKQFSGPLEAGKR